MPDDADPFVATNDAIASVADHHEDGSLWVFEAELTDGTPVRLITPAPDGERFQERCDAFERRAAAWEQASENPGVVTLHARGTEPRPWIAVDRFAGATLETIQPELTRQEALAVVDSVARTVRELSRGGLSHLDLSPEHIDVRRTEDGVRARIDDWGVRRACLLADETRPLSPYTAPELLDDPDDVTKRTDVYGVAAVAFFALTGHPPVDPDGSLDAAIQSGSIPQPTDIDGTLPESVDEVLGRGLSRAPGERQESTFVLRKGLERAFETTDSGQPGTHPTAHDSAADGTEDSNDPADEPVDAGVTSAIRDYPESAQSDTHTGDPQTSTADPADDRPGDQSKRRNVAIAAGLGLLGVILLAIVSSIFGAIGIALGLPLAAVLIVGTVIGQYTGFVGLSVAYFRRRGFTREQALSYLGVRWPTLRELGLVIAGYLAILALSAVIGVFIELLDLETAQGAERQVSGIEDPSPLLAVGVLALMFFVVGPCEEILYRGVVQGRLREHLDPAPAIIIASVVFAVVHVIALAGSVVGALVTIAILFVTANVLGSVYEYTGNIAVPVLLHAMHNSILLIVLLYGPQLEGEAATLGAAMLTLIGL